VSTNDFMVKHFRPSAKPEIQARNSPSALRRLKQGLGRLLIPKLPVTRRLFETVRRELNCAWVRLNNVVNPLYVHRRKRLRMGTGISVNIGCGPCGRDGWVNLDLMKMPKVSLRYDCRRGLPLANLSVKRIRCEHFLEHLDFHAEAPRLLSDCFRVLEEGGTLRIVVPDVASYMRAYCSGERRDWLALGSDPDNLPGDLVTRIGVINHVFHQGGEHLYGYDFETLATCLRSAGFSGVELSSFGNAIDPELRDDALNHRPYSLYVDAVK
jgi:predicted SAM-dependent methyltransferase